MIGLLNAVLDLDHPVEEVEILNPFSYQEFAEQKQIVLDIRARDSKGRLFDVEMQISVIDGLLRRLVYYVCELFAGQMKRGDDFIGTKRTKRTRKQREREGLPDCASRGSCC